jgi:hypothetical protein
MSWVEIVKQYAKENGGKFVIPKRDSEDYAKVRAIQERLRKVAESPAPVVEEKKKRVKKEKVAQPATEPTTVVHPAPKKAKEAPAIGAKQAQPASESTTIVTPAPKEKKPRMKKSEKIALVKEEEAKEIAKPKRMRKKAVEVVEVV